MHDLPRAVFSSKDTRRPQRDGRKRFPSGNLRPEPLDFDNVRQFWSGVLRDVLEARDLPIGVLRRRTVHDSGHVRPPTAHRAKGVAEGHVITLRE